MKIGYNDGIGPFKGKCGDLVYCYSRRYGYVFARKLVYPTLTSVNETIGSKSKMIFALAPSAEYRSDFYQYTWQYDNLRENVKHPMRAWSNLYVKLMYAMEKAYPGVDLRTITREYVYEHDLPCLSIKKAVEAGLLPKVRDWQNYDHQL